MPIRPTHRPRVLAFLASGVLLVAGCGDRSEPGAAATVVGWELGKLPPVVPLRTIEGDGGLVVHVVAEGEGEVLPPAQPIDVQYTLHLLNGRRVETGTIRGLSRPSAENLIAGFLRGLDGIRMMEKRRLYVPPSLGYKEAGSGSTIPPNARLVFDVRPVQLVARDLVVGDGEEALEGKRIRVHYEGRLEDGTVFDSSVARGQPITAALVRNQFIDGWVDGIPGMKVGGKRELWIPYHLAYDARRGPGAKLPPYSDLRFTIELLGVE